MLKKVILVYKRSAFETYCRCHARRLRALLKAGDEGLRRLRSSHLSHYQTFQLVLDVLKRKKIHVRCLERGQEFNESAYDLVLTVGGDGTFLDAAREVRKRLILGINSDPRHSVGKFCASNRDLFETHLEEFEKRRYRIRRLSRMAVRHNGQLYPKPVLNDILVCHLCPAAVSHYILKIGSRIERQWGSGMWIATAAGSSGAVHSAGGGILPLESKKIQYMPRELYEGRGVRCRFRGGPLSGGVSILLQSQMQEGVIYFDGAHHHVHFEFGNHLMVKGGYLPLNAVFFK